MNESMVQPNVLSLLPFVTLLLAIALVPFWFPGWWTKHYPKVCCILGMVVVLYYLCVLQAPGHTLKAAEDYISFMAVVGSMFVISGGIHIQVKSGSTPLANTLLLAGGGLLANLMGTTGASMLLIRPWIRMNKHRFAGYHIAFFIFIVSNLGGYLTPVGPPLFMGYLIDVPFWWVAVHGWKIWLTGMAILLAMFFALDVRNSRRAPKPAPEPGISNDRWHVDGLGNLLCLAVAFGAVFIQRPFMLRESLMAVAAVVSYFTTKKSVYEANRFEFGPVKEVAILFLGIFATMIPALDWLQANAEKFATASPAVYYFGSGILSSVLDNAPTYLSFTSALSGVAGTTDMHVLLAGRATFMLAISTGSVFFGANTYIGNGPNLMVKAIAEHERVPTPNFVAYILRYAIPFMAPMLLIVWWIFFRG